MNTTGMCTNPARNRFAISVMFALGTGISSLASILGSLEKIPDSYKIPIGSVGFVINGLLAFFFQGKSIRDPDDLDLNSEESGLESINVGSRQQAVVEYTRACVSSPFCQRTTETGLILVILGNNFVQRYYLSLNLTRYVGLSAKYVLPSTSILFTIKSIFDLTNEGLETVNSLAKIMSSVEPGQTLLQKGLRYMLKSPRLQDTLVILGVLEHSLLDDLLPWPLLAPTTWGQSFISYFDLSPPAFTTKTV